MSGGLQHKRDCKVHVSEAILQLKVHKIVPASRRKVRRIGLILKHKGELILIKSVHKGDKIGRTLRPKAPKSVKVLRHKSVLKELESAVILEVKVKLI